MTYEKACPCCGGGEYAEEDKKTVIPEESGAAETCCGEDKKAADGGAADGEPTACCNTMVSGNGCGCCGKTTERPERERQKLIHRLNRIEGQIRGIRGMVENNAYCADILVQSAAVNAAVSAFNRELLTSHIHGCVARDIRAGKDEVIDELIQTLGRLMK